MRTIYVDSQFKCRTANDGTMTAVETDFFDGKCDAFVMGYCFEPDVGKGEKIYPWKPYEELDNAQREYERQLLKEYEAALETGIPVSELEDAYREGVNSAYD